MGSYEGTISVLEAELAAVERVFAGLSDDEWRLPTKLVPVDPDRAVIAATDGPEPLAGAAGHDPGLASGLLSRWW